MNENNNTEKNRGCVVANLHKPYGTHTTRTENPKNEELTAARVRVKEMISIVQTVDLDEQRRLMKNFNNHFFHEEILNFL
jgi:hypothetical protein